MISKEQVDQLMNKNPNLTKQTYDQINSLNPQDIQIISRQATINIGTIGHVAHGKSTLVKAISGVHTVRFYNEKIRNITIKLGYANAKIYKCPKCKAPECYQSFSSNKEDKPKCQNLNCNEILELIRHISFVDCPGHEILMATMLTGAAVMDATLLIIAGNMSCPQPQTSEHLAAVEIMQLPKIIIVQNKIDIIFREKDQAVKNFEEIKKFVYGTRAENSPIIPISAQLGYNVDVVLQYICDYIPIPKRNLTTSPKLMIIRSFDVNKPGESFETLKGGVVGGSVLQGILKVGDEVEIRPGTITKSSNGQCKYTPIFSRVVSLLAEQNELLYAIPGGLIGVGLKVDPTLTRSDRLVGSVLGYPGQLPQVYIELDVEFYLLGRLLGVKIDQFTKNEKIRKITKLETLMVNVGSTSTGGKILQIKQLIVAVCTSPGEKVALSRRIDKKWRLIGWGVITKGVILEIKH